MNIIKKSATAALEDIPSYGISSVAKYVILEPKNNFALLHHPNQWELTEEGEWLPCLSEVDIRPGANYVAGSVGKENLSQFKEWFTQKGSTYINPADKRLGEFANIFCSKKGLYKISSSKSNPAFSYHYLGCGVCSLIPTVQKNGDVLITPVLNVARYRDFRRHLVTSGIVDPVQEYVLNRELDIMISTRDRMSIFDRLSETAKAELAIIKKKIDIIRSQLASLNEEESQEVDMSTALEDSAAEPIDFTPPSPVEKVRKTRKAQTNET